MILSWLPLNVNFAHVRSHLTALKISSSKIIVNLARIFNKLIDPRCFPHIVNLACKAVIAALARSDYGSITGDHTDSISTLRALVRAVCIICQLFKLDLTSFRPMPTARHSLMLGHSFGTGHSLLGASPLDPLVHIFNPSSCTQVSSQSSMLHL